MSGIYLVTLPIGNLKDITLRAIETIESSQYIYAEDTRVFKSLCRNLDLPLVNKKVDSFHDHTDTNKLNLLISLAKEEKVIFVSDAGSPLISDPAFPILQRAKEEGVKIHSISGVSSVLVALELSALAPTPFHFHGFIGRENSKKTELFEDIDSQYGTHIFFEGVSRVEKTLAELSKKFPENEIVVARELTKEFESIYSFKGKDFSQVEIIYKGEFVILVNNPHKSSKVTGKVKELALDIINKGAKPKALSKLLSAITGLNGKDVYDKMQK